MNLKWIDNTNKINKLEKMGIKGVSDKAKEVKPVTDAKKKLEEEKKEIENKAGEVNELIIKLEEEAKKVLMEKEEFEFDATGTTTTGVVGKGGKTKTANFKATYKYVANLEDWHRDLLNNKLDNLYEVNWRGTKYNTLEEIGAMRIAFEVCWQIAQATDFDAKVDANKSSYIDTGTIKADLKNAFNIIKGYAANMKDEGDSGEKGGTPTSKVIGTTVDSNGKTKNIYLKVHEYSEKAYNFNFKVFFEFMEILAPLNQINGGSAKHLIDELSGPWGTEKKKWCTWEASSTAMSKEERDHHVEMGNAPQIWKNKDFKAYWEDTSKSKIIELDSGLRGWIELYHAIFANRGNREKLSLIRDGENMYDATKKITVKDSNFTRVLDLSDPAFKGSYTYESEVLTDENGNKQTVWCIYDSDDRIRLLDLRKRNLENRAESLSKNDLTIQNKLAEEKASKIREEEAKLAEKDREIQKLVEEEIKSKQKKVTDAAIISWGDDKWNDSKNVLKAAATKKLLLDIKWLENDGSDKGSFKKADNQTVLDAIETKRKASPQLWNAVIKQYFENLGTDLSSQIAAGKANTEIGLEIIRDAYEEIGDKTVLDAINAELAKEKSDSPVSDLTPEKLTELFGFSVDETLKGNWIKSDGGTIDESKINSIVINEYAKGKNKFNELMTYLKSEGDDEGKKDYEIDDDNKKSASWEKFVKKGAKTVIRTIVAYERKEDLKKTVDKDNPIVKEMMSDTDAGYNTDHSKCKFNKDRYGNPEVPSTIDKSKLITFLHDKKVGNIQQGSVWEQREEEIPKDTGDGDGDKKKWYDIGTTTGKVLWIGGGSVLVIAVLAAIFWKNISDWWNGPAEEQGEGKVEDEKNDEENE